MNRLALALVLVAACGPTAPPATSHLAPGAPAIRSPQPASPAPTPSGPAAFGVQVTGHGRDVIFIPGLACAGSVWDGVIAHLGGKVTAHVLTLAGFAGQPAIAPPLLQTVHDQIGAYIRDHHLDHPIIVGHSLGGVMALWLAETEPNLGGVIDVEGLPFLPAVTDPTATAETMKAMAKQMHDQVAAASHADLVQLMKGSMASMVSSTQDLDRVMDGVAKSDGASVANAFEEMFTTDLRPNLAHITAPVLIIAAGDSHGMPRDKLEALWHAQIDAIPHHELELVDHARHFVMLDQPDAFDKLVDAFLLAHAR